MSMVSLRLRRARVTRTLDMQMPSGDVSGRVLDAGVKSGSGVAYAANLNMPRVLVARSLGRDRHSAWRLEY
jgi:hypothetical protein